MFIRLNICRLSSTFVDIGAQMKQLNDNGQYRKSLLLFENLIKKNNKTPTSLVINQALKACIELEDFKRGENIHKHLSPYLLKNSFIETNLIRLYSNFLFFRCDRINKQSYLNIFYSEIW